MRPSTGLCRYPVRRRTLDFDERDFARGAEPNALASDAQSAVHVEIAAVALEQPPVKGGDEFCQVADATFEPRHTELAAMRVSRQGQRHACGGGLRKNIRTVRQQ